MFNYDYASFKMRGLRGDTSVMPAKAGIVRPRGRFASAVKVRAWVGRSPVIEGNCVVARRGGEQLEVKRQSVG